MDTLEKTSRHQAFHSLLERTVMLPAARLQTGTVPRTIQHMPTREETRIENALNPILTAACSLVTILARLRQPGNWHDARHVHGELISLLKKFDADCKLRGIAPEHGLVARYLLCTALDEAVLATAWGADSGWAQRSLLALFHQDTFGGEKFFVILDKLLAKPNENSALLELIYVSLCLDFQGKYSLLPQGREQLRHIKEQLFLTLTTLRGAPPSELSPHWKGFAGQLGLARFTPLWKIFAVVGICLLTAFMVLRADLSWDTGAAVERMDALAPTSLH